jgi:hypothetical protein
LLSIFFFISENLTPFFYTYWTHNNSQRRRNCKEITNIKVSHDVPTSIYCGS